MCCFDDCLTPAFCYCVVIVLCFLSFFVWQGSYCAGIHAIIVGCQAAGCAAHISQLAPRDPKIQDTSWGGSAGVVVVVVVWGELGGAASLLAARVAHEAGGRACMMARVLLWL